MCLKNFYSFWLLFALGLIVSLGLHFIPTPLVAIAIPSTPGLEVTQNSPEQQAIANYNRGNYREAIALWREALRQNPDKKAAATIYTNLGATYRQIGELGEAIAAWKQAAQLYKSMQNEESQRSLAQVLTEQAQAHNALGQFRVALPILQSAVEIAQKHQDRNTEAAARGALGNAYAAAGDFENAIAAHQASLDLAATLNNPLLTTTTLNNIGKVYFSRYQRYLVQANSARREGDEKEETRLINLAQQDLKAAQAAYERSVQESKPLGGIVQAKALINLAQLLQQLPGYQTEISAKIETYRQQAIASLETVPDSRAKAYALINLAENLSNPEPIKVQTLEKAIALAQRIGDRRAESFALGILGKFYASKDLSKAMQLTQQAQLAAQQTNAADSLYRWQAQAGRLYKASGKTEAAIVAYRQAIATLQTIRGDLAVASKDLQLDLRDSVAPVYRELMALLLQDTGEGDNIQNVQSKIEEALQTSEQLQLTELQNFFGDECTEVKPTTIEPIAELSKTNTAVINSIITGDRTYIILRLPDGSFKRYPVALSPQELEKTIDRLRFTLEDISTDEYLEEAKKAYDLFIQPMAADLEQAKPKTLVFINDGVLKNIPMAALYDGKQYLVEKYAIATTLGLNLTLSKTEKQSNNQALIFGLSAEIPPFAPLPNVPAEAKIVQKILGGEKFLDQDFNAENLHKQIKTGNYPIVHLATHGKFGADPSSTFLQLFDRRVSLNEFETILRQSQQPINLLTLSACQTAAGDERSTLGIAGVALRAGVKSTLASLWFVNDADTVPLIEDFYTKMRQPGITKAEALRQAQLKAIADPNGHPAIWSPFVLVGNWQ
ncbi:MAG TPA: hypothetical protein DCY88_20165 [Cyanobacteria bacterium UBA11372]|nr:hypothetical protein [Cyanobacteria bacterium UBA11372]